MESYMMEVRKYHAQAEAWHANTPAHAALHDPQTRLVRLSDEMSRLRVCSNNIEDQIKKARLDGVDTSEMEALLAQVKGWSSDVIHLLGLI